MTTPSTLTSTHKYDRKIFMTTLTRSTTALLAAAAVIGLAPAGVATAATPPLSKPVISAHFDFAKGQLPENLVLEPGGSVAVTFAGSRQVARVDAKGGVHVLATLPAPSEAEGKTTPVLHFPLATGLARTTSGVLYALYAAGSSRLTGLWRVVPGHAPVRVAALSAKGLPNGLALSADGTQAYVADSVQGRIYRIRLSDGVVRTWAKDTSLQAAGFLGANGVKVHGQAVWVSNLDKGTLLRIPLTGSGAAGTPSVAARGLKGIDDFTFTGEDNTVLATLNQPNTVVLVTPGHKAQTVLTAADGLQGPTAVALRGSVVYVTSAAYNTQTDPNLLTAKVDAHVVHQGSNR